MDSFTETKERFVECLQRARTICELQGYLSDTHSKALDTSDMLRASVVLCISAFDFLVHELFRIEVVNRYRSGTSVRRVQLPFDTAIASESRKEELIESHVREINSYKSFVDPGKFSEAMGCFVEDPWSKISAKLGQDPSEVKRRIRSIYRWRNRIAHEADINPVYAGIELWPIDKDDVIGAVSYIERVGLASVEVLRESQ